DPPRRRGGRVLSSSEKEDALEEAAGGGAPAHSPRRDQQPSPGLSQHLQRADLKYRWVAPVHTPTAPLQDAAPEIVGATAGELRVGAADRFEEVGVATADLRQVVSLLVEGGGLPQPDPRSGS